MFIKGLQSLLADVYFFLTIYFIGQRNLLNNGDGLKDSVIRCLNFDAYIAKPAGSPRNIWTLTIVDRSLKESFVMGQRNLLLDAWNLMLFWKTRWKYAKHSYPTESMSWGYIFLPCRPGARKYFVCQAI